MYLKLKDNITITHVSEEESTAGNIVIMPQTWGELQSDYYECSLPGNLDHFEFFREGEEKPFGVYENYVFDNATVSGTDSLKLVIHAHQKSEIDMLRERLAAVESSQVDQDDAINYLLMGGEPEPVEESSTEPAAEAGEDPAESEVE